MPTQLPISNGDLVCRWSRTKTVEAGSIITSNSLRIGLCPVIEPFLISFKFSGWTIDEMNIEIDLIAVLKQIQFLDCQMAIRIVYLMKIMYRGIS